MQAFFLVSLCLSLIGNSLTLPQRYYSSRWTTPSLFNTGADTAGKGLQLGNDLFQMVAGLKGGAINAGSDMAQMGLSHGASLGSQGLQQATSIAHQGLDLAENVLGNMPVFGGALRFFTGLGKAGMNAANAVGQAGLGIAHGVAREGVAAANTASQLATGTLANMANIGTGLGRLGLQAGANALTQGLGGIRYPQFGGGSGGSVGSFQYGGRFGLPSFGGSGGSGGGRQQAQLTIQQTIRQPQRVIGNMQKEMGALLNGLKEKAGNVASQLSTLMSGEGEEIVKQMKDKIGNIANEFESLASGDSVKQITDNISVTKNKLQNLAKEIQSLLESQSGKPIGDQLKGLSDNVSVLLSHFGSAVGGPTGGKLMADIGNHVGNAVGEVGEILNGESLHKITTTMEQLTNSLGDAANQVGTVIQEKGRPVGEMLEKVGEKVESVMSEFGSAVGGNTGKKLLGDIGEQMGSVMTNMASLWESEPAHKLTALAGGIGSEVGQAVSDLNQILSNTSREDVMRIINTTGSAAKLLSQYGGLIGQMMGAHIDNNPGEKLANPVGSNMQNLLSTVSSFISSVTKP